MKVTKVTCDLCGKELDSSREQRRVPIYERGDYSYTFKSLDLCDECYDKSVAIEFVYDYDRTSSECKATYRWRRS